MQTASYPIDVFVPWVNPNDDAWYHDYCQACAEHTGDKSPQRIRDFGTFKYLLRSIDKNMPWINKIHVLLYAHSQIPSWLNTNYSKLVIHTHNEICKPSFNQLYFTRFIGNLSDLAEHFIYLCDDQIILNPMDPTDWFVEGIPTDNAVESQVISSNPIDEAGLLNANLTVADQVGNHKLDFFQRLVKNSMFLAGAVTNQLKIYKNFHTGIACIKSEYKTIMDKLSIPLDKMFTNYWFRDNNQVIPHWLYRYIRLSTGHYSQYDMNTRIYREITTGNVDFIYNDLKHPYKLCCLNDILRSDDIFTDAANNVRTALDIIFPSASPFER